MTAAPDVAEPLIGYRAWHVEGGRLLPATQTQAGPWKRGVNSARCVTWRASRGGGKMAHQPPAAGCTCGLYALRSPRSGQLRRAGLPYGAIAAWGDVEVHHSGFRAQHACVVALALSPSLPASTRREIERAADFYGVPALAPGLLEMEACQHGRPLSDELASGTTPQRPRRPRPSRNGVSGGTFHAGRAAFWPERHVFAQPDGSHVVAGPTPALWARAQPRVAVRVAPPGRYVARGATLAQIPTRDGMLSVSAPLSGQVVQVNLSALVAASSSGPRLAVSPGWAVRLRPADWASEVEDLIPAPAGEQGERALLDLAADGIDAFASLRAPTDDGLHAPRLEWDRLARDPGQRACRYADAGDLERVVASFLARHLAPGAALWPARALGVVAQLQVHDLHARTTVALTQGPTEGCVWSGAPVRRPTCAWPWTPPPPTPSGSASSTSPPPCGRARWR